MPTLLSVNNYYFIKDGGDVCYFEHNRLFEDSGWHVVPFSMHNHKNIYTPWSKFFIKKEIDYDQEYSIWEKLVRIPKVIYSFEAIRTLRNLIDTVPIDVSHCHTIYHRISPSILNLLKKRGVPTVMTLHDLKIACSSYCMLNRGEICERCKGGKFHNILLNRCMKDSFALSAIAFMERFLHCILRTYKRTVSRFIVPSDFYIKKFVDWGWNPEFFIHIPNFVNTSAFQPEFQPGKAFLYFGRLSQEKGLITLIRAASLANVQIIIAGSGPQLPMLQEEAEKTQCDIKFLGHLAGIKLQNAIRSARATVIPSEWYENAPMSILESYALGKPVIGATIGGIPELIRNYITGITFKSGSIESLADALKSFVNLPDAKLLKMGQNGRSWVESDYSEERYKERIFSLYKEIGVAF